MILGGPIENGFLPSNVIFETATANVEYEPYSVIGDHLHFERPGQKHQNFVHELLEKGIGRALKAQTADSIPSGKLQIGEIQMPSGELRSYLASIHIPTLSYDLANGPMQRGRPIFMTLFWLLEPNQKVTTREVELMEKAAGQLMVIQAHLNPILTGAHRTPRAGILKIAIDKLAPPLPWTAESRWKYNLDGLNSNTPENIQRIKDYRFSKIYRIPEPFRLGVAIPNNIVPELLDRNKLLPAKEKAVDKQAEKVAPESSAVSGTSHPESSTRTSSRSYLRVGSGIAAGAAILGGATYWAYNKWHRSNTAAPSPAPKRAQ